MTAADVEWMTALRAACTLHGQKATARQVGYSPAVVSQVLSGTYKGNLTAVQSAVEGALMGSVVDCPVAGEIPRQRCIEHQRSEMSAANPMRVQLARVCPTCPNRRANS